MDRLFHLNNPSKPAQSEVIGAMWEASGPRDVLVSAAGSHPGDLHKLWRTRTPNGYHMEYGYSCMGYEIPGAMGAKLADPTPRGLRLPGRWHLPDDAHGNRDVRAGGHQDHHRAGGQSWLCQHRRAEPVAGARRIRHQLSGPLQGVGTTGWRVPDRGLCCQRAQSGCARLARRAPWRN